MNLPLKITYFRIILIPLIVFVFYFSKFGILLSGVIFIIASITDFLDGYLARKRNEITNLGIFLDPLADKILTMTIFLLLISINRIPVWSVILILSREFLINGLRFIAAEKKIIIGSSFLGKIKTVTQMISLSFLMFTSLNNYFLLIGINLYWLSLFASIISGIEYIYQKRSLLK